MEPLLDIAAENSVRPLLDIPAESNVEALLDIAAENNVQPLSHEVQHWCNPCHAW